MINLKKVQRIIDGLDDTALYSPKQITDLEVVVNTKLKESRFTLYRLMHSGKLPAINLGTGSQPRYFFRGRDLKAVIRNRYGLK